MAPTFHIRVLGPTSVHDQHGQLIKVSGRKPLALLIYMIIHHDRFVSREDLAQLLWPDRSDDQARTSLRQLLYQLRRMFDRDDATPAPPVSGLGSIGLSEATTTVDLWQIERAAHGSEIDDPLGLLAAVEGPLASDLGPVSPEFDQWLDTERIRTARLVSQRLEAWAARAERQGRYDQALEIGHKLIALDPCHEPGHRLLMRAYRATGRRDLAVGTFRRLKELLRSDIGVEPDPETLGLLQSILGSEEVTQQTNAPPAAPVLSGPDPAIAPATREAERGPEPVYHVLIVDDSAFHAQVTAQAVRRLGYGAVVAKDGNEALQSLTERRFDLILTDCRMPGVDGYTLARAIRDATPGTQVPIIAMTGDATVDAARRCLESGMDDYLGKPVSHAQLEEMLRRWLPADRSPGVPFDVVFDSAALYRSVGDEADAIPTLNEFLESTTTTIDRLCDALSLGDVDLAHSLVSSLTSDAQTVGGLALARACALIESAVADGDLGLALARRGSLVAAFAHFERSAKRLS